ncbi:MAG: hypothetical protein DMD84_27240 [Candidatus Rokuibacteriota bacterium]|nr:MAG: hypothetical protein DMD84_27240 [Candidatus Rokubacteria bacterium]
MPARSARGFRAGRIEERHGFPAALRALGGVGGHVGAPFTTRLIEERHDSFGARRALGGVGAMSGPPTSLGA